MPHVPQTLYEVARRRRTHRRLAPGPPPDAAIRYALLVAARTPSPFHLQPWRVQPVSRPALLARWLQGHPVTPADLATLAGATRALLLLEDIHAWTAFPVGSREMAARLETAIQQAMGAFALSLWLGLTARGLACRWLHFPWEAEEDMVRRWAVLDPRRYRPHGVLAIGYPASPLREKPRLLVADILLPEPARPMLP